MGDLPSARLPLERERSRIVAFLTSRVARDVRVFGSIALRDDERRSNIDNLVDLGSELSTGAELLTVLGLSEELSVLVGRRVDVATERTLRPGVRERVVVEAMPL